MVDAADPEATAGYGSITVLAGVWYEPAEPPLKHEGHSLQTTASAAEAAATVPHPTSAWAGAAAEPATVPPTTLPILADGNAAGPAVQPTFAHVTAPFHPRQHTLPSRPIAGVPAAPLPHGPGLKLPALLLTRSPFPAPHRLATAVSPQPAPKIASPGHCPACPPLGKHVAHSCSRAGQRGGPTSRTGPLGPKRGGINVGRAPKAQAIRRPSDRKRVRTKLRPGKTALAMIVATDRDTQSGGDDPAQPVRDFLARPSVLPAALRSSTWPHKARGVLEKARKTAPLSP